MSYMDTKIVPEAPDSRAPRQRRLIRAQLTDRMNRTYEIVIRNVSSKGVGATTRGPVPREGEQVHLILPESDLLNGVIRWVSEQAFGIELEHDLDLAMLADAMQRRSQASDETLNWEVQRLHQVATQGIDPSRLRRI